MKKSKNLLFTLGIIAALVIGFLVGLVVNFPPAGESAISGTIGKVDHYRNIQASEADIELRNELTTDTTKLRHLQNYLNFYYVNAVKMAEDIDFTVQQADDEEVFKKDYASQIMNLERYKDFLIPARTNLLMALAACKNVQDTDPRLLKDLLNRAQNSVAQINYRDRLVLDFIRTLNAFIGKNGEGRFPGLEEAHDRLAVNKLYSSLITKDKMVLKFLEKTDLYSKSTEKLRNWDQGKFNDAIQQDVTILKFHDQDINDLNDYAGDKAIVQDMVQDFNQLSSNWDQNKLNSCLDQNNLNDIAQDANIVGSQIIQDMGNLVQSAIVQDQIVGDFAQDQIVQDQLVGDFAVGDFAVGDFAVGDFAVGDFAIGDIHTQ
jgi:hypothetical protein